MNTAQQNIKEVAEKLKQSNYLSGPKKDYYLSFLRKLYVVWGGYSDSRQSFPRFQIEKLEKDYGTDLKEISILVG